MKERTIRRVLGLKDSRNSFCVFLRPCQLPGNTGGNKEARQLWPLPCFSALRFFLPFSVLQRIYKFVMISLSKFGDFFWAVTIAIIFMRMTMMMSFTSCGGGAARIFKRWFLRNKSLYRQATTQIITSYIWFFFITQDFNCLLFFTLCR